MKPSTVFDRYSEALTANLCSPQGAAGGESTTLGREFVRDGIDPDEIVAMHGEILARANGDSPPCLPIERAERARQFLLEAMIAYGQAQRELLALEAAEREQAAHQDEQDRTELLATVAHEMRTPLTAALGAIDLIERDLARERLDRIAPWLAAAREALQRLSRQTMDIARASTGEQTGLNIASHDVCAVVAEVVAWAETAASEKGLALIFNNAPRTVPVDGDADALLSIFGNLLTNAIRYTPAGGSIRVVCGSAGADAWVEIADSGIGMTPEVQRRIFEKFYRAPEARAAAAQGLGLGLSLVQDLVHGHGGSVEVWSVLGEGSTFRVVLPGSGAARAFPVRGNR